METKIRKSRAIFLLLGIYFIASLLTFFIWESKGRYSVTGDEPHYLVMASGIAKYGVLEQTLPYKMEFQTRKIYKHGLAPMDAIPSPVNTHAAQGPNGLFNVHNPGLPLILALPFLWKGVVGAKIFMIVLGSLIVVIAWKISRVFSTESKVRFWAVLAASIALPLVPGSNQIYPDMLAGLISLNALYWFMTINEKRPVLLEVFFISTLVFLPWLQVKFVATSVLLVLILVWKIYCRSKDFRDVTRILLASFISCALLVTYNYYAFGKFSGFYQSGALEISKHALMVLSGLHFDQNQGFLLQNPVMLVGIFSMGLFFKYSKQLGVVWLLVFLSLIVPNALHPNWYGGLSFSGRFAWGASTVFIVPTVFGLTRIFQKNRFLFRVIVSLSVLIQIVFYCRYTFGHIKLYNKAPSITLDHYSIFYSPIKAWVPAFYNITWAYEYTPNLIWLIILITLLFFGFFVSSRTS